MSHTVLEKAHSLLQRRKFSYVISLLESGNNPEIYRESFDYFITAGIACLYLGDTGSAGAYFQHARHIRMTDPTLLCCQAVLFLRRGDIDKAISYYVDVLDYDPNNKLALEAMDFIRTHGTYEEVCKAVDSGEIERFYPALGINPDFIKRIALSVFAGIVLAFIIFNFGRFSRLTANIRGAFSNPSSDLSSLYLSVEELGNAHEPNTDNTSFKYKLTDEQIKKSYEKAMSYFQSYHENASQVEINRLMNSNASDAIKAKSRMILSYFKGHTFDTLSNYDDNIEYSEVKKAEDEKQADLYLGCIVCWSGYVSNVVTEGKSYRCDLFVGDDNRKRVEGAAPLVFDIAPYPEIDSERPVKVLAKIKVKNGKILLEGRSVYQAIR